jgi:hypothetical protein
MLVKPGAASNLLPIIREKGNMKYLLLEIVVVPLANGEYQAAKAGKLIRYWENNNASV